MKTKPQIVKMLTSIIVCSYFSYAIYWLIKTIPWIIEISLRPEHYVPATGVSSNYSYILSFAFFMEYVGFFGLMIRVVGASFALLSIFLIFKNKKDRFYVIQNSISTAIILEGVYYLFFIPAIIFMLLNFTALPKISNLLLSTAFSTQILLITPLLIKLGSIVKNFESSINKILLIRYIGLSYMSFVISLWITYILKWIEMMAVDPYLFSALSFRILGFLNTVIVQSLTIIFAVIGVMFILKNHLNKAIRWLGFSLIFLSLHIIIYVIYVTSVGITRFIQFGELWLIPIFGLGIYLLYKNPKEIKF